ncbi:TPA: acetyl-CoA carboxylase biotin carboxylase subunit [Candidatus Poribacteria bacterium]|nr:acetyl-CoA carboxylase biotin carboxylase subunit [Candidatus Poribacteria bacterium]
MPFNKILVANRGEIAIRVMRACREMGIRTVAVYSTADADSMHVKYADEAVCIGPSDKSKSYLSLSNIISAADITNAEAIHPGTGFLAEAPHFAEACRDHGITFIGPTPENIEMMGDKARARQVMDKAGISPIPGSKGILRNEKEAIKLARKLGYPVVVKSAAGGGGIGIREAYNDAGLLNAFQLVQSEAKSAFGRSEVYIEKLIERAKHIEFQILADKYGNVVCLGERDCSVQRRKQKLIEETPCLMLNPKIREDIIKSLIKAIRNIKYTNVGTVEFLMDPEGKSYFMEMNTRIQVEHTITEEVTGLDLLKEQIRLSAGERLTLRQNDIQLNGHAIECRINAEDPDKKFMPSPGMIDDFHAPGGIGVRLDTHIYRGYKIPPFYDSLIAKLITHGKNRDEAISRMKRALDEIIISGIKTTIPFHKKILEDERFLRGEVYVNFLNSFSMSE